MPESFGPDRTAVAFSHVQNDIWSSSHALGARLPRATTRPKIVGDPNEFEEFILPPEAPRKLDDYLNSDRRQIGLHITTFQDMTIVTLYFPHTLMDAMGQKALLDAWSWILRGEEENVTTPYGTESNPLAILGTASGESYKLASQQLGFLGLVGYGLKQAVNFIWPSENRMICVPARFSEDLRRNTMDELATVSSDEVLGELYLTNSDILCAWWTRILVSHSSCYPEQTITVNNAFDIRKALRSDLIPEGATYVSNAVGFINVLLSAKDVLEKPLAYTALEIRGAITDLGTRKQVESFFSLVRQNPGKLPPFFGDSNMHLITFSNWSKANLYELDFGAAVTKGFSADLAKPRYIQNTQLGFTPPNAFPIIGKDREGNFWLSGYLKRGQWAEIESQFTEHS